MRDIFLLALLVIMASAFFASFKGCADFESTLKTGGVKAVAEKIWHGDN